MENHPEYALIFYKSHHTSPNATSVNPNQDNIAHVQFNAPGVDHRFTVTGNRPETSAGPDSHMTQPTNEQSLSSETEIVQPSQSLPHETTVTIEIEEC